MTSEKAAKRCQQARNLLQRRTSEHQILTLCFQQTWLLPIACFMLSAGEKKNKFITLAFSKLKSREVIGHTTATKKSPKTKLSSAFPEPIFCSLDTIHRLPNFNCLEIITRGKRSMLHPDDTSSSTGTCTQCRSMSSPIPSHYKEMIAITDLTIFSILYFVSSWNQSY